MTLRKLNSRSLLGNITLLNVLLVLCAVVLTGLNMDPMSARDFTLQVQGENAREKSLAEGVSEGQFLSAADYVMVGENNLFHPERLIPAQKKEEKPLPKPEIVLHGTMISDDLKIAYVQDLKAPRSTPGRGTRQLPLRQGDVLGGFVLKEISIDKIVMVRGEEVLNISIYDSHRKSKNVASAAITSAKPPQAAQHVKESVVPKSTKAIDQEVFKFFQGKRADVADR